MFLGAKGVKEQSGLMSKVLYKGANGVKKHSVLRSKVF
jgi:hypothetical protein